MKNYLVYLSTIAEFKLVKVLEYILQEFGLAAREKFLKKFKENIKKSVQILFRVQNQN